MTSKLEPLKQEVTVSNASFYASSLVLAAYKSEKKTKKSYYASTFPVFSELSKLLFYMLTSYANTDIQDKAKLYYCLITSAADQKVM